MSNVVKAASGVVSTTQFAVVGKIYEELFTDSNGNTMVRYLRMFKADGTVTAGQMLGCDDAAGESEMYLTGKAKPSPDAVAPKTRLYGVALTGVASGSYGWCVCRGVVDVDAEADVNAEGKFLATHANNGSVSDDSAIGSGHSITIVGISLAARSGSQAKAYIDVL